MTRLACDDDAGAVVEAVGDGEFTDDVIAGRAVGVLHVVQRPCHAQGPVLGLGLVGQIGGKSTVGSNRSVEWGASVSAKS